MRGLFSFRRRNLEVAQIAAGIYRGSSLLTKAHVASAQADADTARMEEAFSENCDIQTSGGAFTFSIDFSAVDGPDPIG